MSGWLDVAASLVSSLNRLLRYVLVTVLVVAAIVIAAAQAFSGDALFLEGFFNKLPIVGNSSGGESRQAPLFKFEFKPPPRDCPVDPPV